MTNNDSKPLGIRLISFWNLSKQQLSAIIVIGRLTFNARIRIECIIILQFTLYTQLIENSLERKIIERNQFPCSCYSSCTHRRLLNYASERHDITLKYRMLAALCYIVVSSVCLSSDHFARRRHSTSQYFIYWFNECNFQHVECQLHLFVLRALSAFFSSFSFSQFHWFLWTQHFSLHSHRLDWMIQKGRDTHIAHRPNGNLIKNFTFIVRKLVWPLDLTSNHPRLLQCAFRTTEMVSSISINIEWLNSKLLYRNQRNPLIFRYIFLLSSRGYLHRTRNVTGLLVPLPSVFAAKHV